MKIEGSFKKSDDELVKRLETMPFKEARTKILNRQLGNSLDSHNHQLCLSWLQLKESELRDERESRTLQFARHAAYAAYAAAIIAAISIIITMIYNS